MCSVDCGRARKRRHQVILDPINEIENSDASEVECCRHCHELIEPGREVPWNGWFWHYNCAPSHVIYGIEQEQRDAERAER